ncbi:MAG: 4,5-DOPA dioxygenase extradiol [Anaeromyxobacter sp.]
MPALFLGHGNPMNALEDNAWSRAFRELGRALPRPKAILAISAHWYADGTFATGDEQPETIHDFGGFPDALYRIEYPAPGDPALARRTVGLLEGRRASLSAEWGLDHGTWSVLVHLRPAADLPVVQLSLDARLPPGEHLAIGRALAPLRDEGVLILGSGNLVHNLRHAFGAWQRGETATPDWARAFDEEVAQALARHDGDELVRLLDTEHGRLAAPTPDHYLPLLYVAGASTAEDPVRFPIRGVRHVVALDEGRAGGVIEAAARAASPEKRRSRPARAPRHLPLARRAAPGRDAPGRDRAPPQPRPA